jgi:hypothetical protein
MGLRKLRNLKVAATKSLNLEPPHKLEKEVFNAKKIGIIFQNDAKETEKKLHITKNGNKS